MNEFDRFFIFCIILAFLLGGFLYLFIPYEPEEPKKDNNIFLEFCQSNCGKMSVLSAHNRTPGVITCTCVVEPKFSQGYSQRTGLRTVEMTFNATTRNFISNISKASFENLHP